MKTLELPYIRFGRNKNGATDFYAVQEQSPSVPENIVTFFRDRVSKSIQWASSAEAEKYADCFLICCTAHSEFLFAKLADGGNDSFGRGHSMQIDAVCVTNKQLPNSLNEKAKFFASLCFSSVWESWEKQRILQLSDENEQKVIELAEKFLAFFSDFSEITPLPHSLFLANHPNFTACGIDQIIRNDKEPPIIKQLIKPIIKTLSQGPIEMKYAHSQVVGSVTPPSSGFSPIISLLIVLTVFSVAGNGLLGWSWYKHAQKMRTDYHLLQINYEDKVSESERLEKENRDTKNLAETRLRLIQEKDSEVTKRDLKIANLEDDKNNLIRQLHSARQNADESLKTENSLLKVENESLKQKMTTIWQHVESIRNEFPQDK
ncbi:MAG: hypothetical protein LBQ66_02605 [Planctomycetaceae bacterium]|jgi:hypothetical protein|nr:hypothetical protein [Planctomycetaceae bacterium]